MAFGIGILKNKRIYISKNSRKLLGYNENEIPEDDYETYETWLQRIHPEDIEKVLSDIKDHFEGQTKLYINEHREKQKDNKSYIWILDRGAIISRDHEGKPLRMIGTNTLITAQKTFEATLKKERAYAAKIIQDMPVFITGVDANGICTFINPAGEKICGYEADEIVGKNWHEMLYPTNIHYTPNEKIKNKLLDHSIPNGETVIVCKNKEKRHILWSHLTRHDKDGKVIEHIGIGLDITQYSLFEEELKKNELRLRKAQEIAKLGGWEIDLESKALSYSDEVYHIFNIQKRSDSSAIRLFFQRSIFKNGKTSLDDLISLLKQKNVLESVSSIAMSDGSIKWVKLIFHIDYDEKKKPLFIQGTIQDITEQIFLRRKLEEINQKLTLKNSMLEKLSMSDGLTQIPNRRYFDKIFEIEFKNMQRKQKPLALMIIDVDYFKAYNDFYGHAKGDQCLYKIAQALKSTLKRPMDIVTRYGGEEFALLFIDSSLDGINKITANIKEAIATLNIAHETSSVASSITVSIGIAYTDGNYSSTQEDFFKEADNALYCAKAKGRNNYMLYEDTLK